MMVSSSPTVNVQQYGRVSHSSSNSELMCKLKKISSGCFFRPDAAFIHTLKEIKPIELTQILSTLLTDMLEEDRLEDPVKFLDRLAEVFPENYLGLFEALDMFDEAKHYLKMTQENISPSIRARLSSILDSIISIIESLITAFGIGDFFKPAETDHEANIKSHKIMMLLSLFMMLTSMIIPLLGAATGGLVIGGILLSIAALSVIWPFIKPVTTHLPANAVNLTKQVRNNGCTAQGRKKSLDAMVNSLKQKRHVILVGLPRIGKSIATKALAAAIARGEYPELEGKVIFRINTADIIGQRAAAGGLCNILNKISDQMGRHRSDIILVFDEIHMACKNNEKLADQLKPFLDEEGDFVHVIGITTKDEYQHVKENDAFALRFDKVDIENTNEDDTLKILADTVLKSPLRPIVEEGSLKENSDYKGALDYIYQRSCKVQNVAQPKAALKLLQKCINQIAATQKSPIEIMIADITTKIETLTSQAAIIPRGNKRKMYEEIRTLKGKRYTLQNTDLPKEQRGLAKLSKSKALLDHVTKEMYIAAIKTQSLYKDRVNPKVDKQAKLFTLLQTFGGLLETHIKAKSKELGVQYVIDKALIDSLA